MTPNGPTATPSSDSECRLRVFANGDYEAAFALWQATEGIGLNESDTRAAIETFLARNPGLSSVALNPAGVLVGTILCGHDGRRGYLHHLAVAPTWRRRGLGRALVDASLNQLRALGIAKCSLFLYANNEAGRAFWTRHGWGAREDLVIVQKALY